MKRFSLLLTLVVATVVSATAQDFYEGQVLTFQLASGDSLIGEFGNNSLHPRFINGEIVWQFESTRKFDLKDVKSVEFITTEQSLARTREALVDFYKAMDGDHWRNNTNWCSDKPLDEWYGIMTNNRPYVWYLGLENNNLKGEVPEGVFFKMGPTALYDLSENQLSGQFPLDWGKSLALQIIRAWQNQLTGELPEKMLDFPMFRMINITENKLTGKIPSGVAGLMNEKNHLDISGNDFSGEVPKEVINHPRFHLMWNDIIPQSGHLTVPTIPGYQLSVTDINGKELNTADIYKDNQYTLIFNYSSARGNFTDKLKKAYDTYKSKGFEVLGMAPGNAEEVNDYLHLNNITWLNLDPDSFGDLIGKYYIYLNFINLVDNNGNVVFTSIMDETGKMEDMWGASKRDQQVFDVLAEKFGNIDFTPYTSTDYSHDGEVMTLQQASVGKGVDIVFIGNCFVDKDMEPGGLYETKMREAMEQFFAYEPYTSLRNRFNVYAVKAVSANKELYEGTKQALNSDEDAFNYAQKITTLIPDRPMRINIIYNCYNAGRSYCTMYNDHSYVALSMNGVSRIINHEGGGHGIGRLYDEYVEIQGSAPQAALEYYENMWNLYGRGANIDMHADVTQTRWARFAADDRYAGEGLGAYEGGGTYEHGIYRPTQNSMMYYNDIPFNAPSREAIYKYVMQESEGPDWKYDYETFVKFDAKGRAQFAEAVANKAPVKRFDDTDTENVPTKADVVEQKPSTAPPVIIQGTWRDALKNPTKINYQR